jgi:hypothetical protein
VDPAEVAAAGDPELTFLVRSADGLGVPLEILELGAPGEGLLPVVLARAADPLTGERRWAAAAGVRRRDAVLDAVRDLLGLCQLAREPEPRSGTAGAPSGIPSGADTGDPLLKDFDPVALIPTASVPAAIPPAGPLPATGPGPDAARAASDWWPALAARLRAAGRDLLAAPVTAPDLAAGRLHVTRVLLTVDGAADAR